MEGLSQAYWFLYHNSDIFRIIRHFFLYVLKIDLHWYFLAAVLFATIIVIRKKSVGLGKAIAFASAVIYIFLLYASLVLSRPMQQEYQCKLELLWTVRAIINGDNKYIQEVIINLLMLFPVGLLLPISSKTNLKKTVLVCALISCSIEFTQLITKTGLFEIDDIIYNTLSAALGYAMFLLVRYIKARVNRRQKF